MCNPFTRAASGALSRGSTGVEEVFPVPKRNRGMRRRVVRFPGWLVALLGAATLLHSAPVTIPFSPRDGRVFLPAQVNGTGPLTFLLDSGYELIMLNPSHAQSLGLRRVGGVTIVGIAGEERAETFGGVMFDFGGTQYQPRRVAALPSDARKRGRDGVLGSGFFKRFVVEIDSRAGQVRLHEPAEFHYDGSGEVLPLTFNGDVPVIEVGLALTNQPALARLKIDTGCDGGVCLGCGFVQQQGWTNAPGRGASTRSGVGGGTRTRRVQLAQVELGRLSTAHVGAHLFDSASPGGDGVAGHLGMEVLKRFTVIFDYAGKRLILEAYPAR